MDFSGQELRLGAERSQDENLLSCYVGDNTRDPHSLTATGIAEKRAIEGLTTYEEFEAARAAGNKEAKSVRNKAKTVNFQTQYMGKAPGLARKLICSVQDAEDFIAAKNLVYAGLHRWQQDTITSAHKLGYTTTLLGARRHLHHKLTSPQQYTIYEAERQAVNFEIQGGSGEMTKLSVNGMWLNRTFERYSAQFAFPVHDETVTFVPEDPELLIPCLQEIHKYMVQKYATMEVPLESEISFGDTFGTMVEVGKHPTEDAILKALEKVKESRNAR
jgi:DNA polymerase I-like protein with 3'-5' exonuclease and polymerase domains